jgi:TolB-like protein/DNA-binding winged helix-turn-helix (wHTH) protein/tetratricopeptide (TPR) repeat protein
MASTDTPDGYRFDDLTVDLVRRCVSRDGAPIQLGKLTYELLVLLASRAPAVVTHDEIATQLWDGRYVSPNTVKQRVHLLRQALSDVAESPHYLDVVRGQGYRLIPTVERLETDSSESPAWPSRRQRPRITSRYMIAAGCLVVLAAAVSSGFWPDGREPDRSIAVLPFENLSPEPTDAYFAAGIHEALIADLQRINELSVVSRDSVIAIDGEDRSSDVLADQLGVRVVMTGSVEVQGERIEISVSLMDASEGKLLWQHAYSELLVDAVTVQRDIVANVVRLVGGTGVLAAEALPEPAIDSEGYRRYMEARSLGRVGLMHGPVPLRAREMLEGIVARYPNFYPAYSALAGNYIDDLQRLGPDEQASRDATVLKARQIIESAALRWPDDPGVYAWRAWFARFERDWEEAAAYYELALAKQPGNPEALAGALFFAVELNRHATAAEIGRYLLDRDPLCIRCYEMFAVALLRLEHHEELAELLTRARELSLDSSTVRGIYGMSLLNQGKAEQALIEFESIASTHDGLIAARLYSSALALRALGREDDYAERVEALKQMNRPTELASLYAAVGELDAAFDALMRPETLWGPIMFDGGLAVMREHARWDELATKAGIYPQDPRDFIRFRVDLPE